MAADFYGVIVLCTFTLNLQYKMSGLLLFFIFFLNNDLTFSMYYFITQGRKKHIIKYVLESQRSNKQG